MSEHSTSRLSVVLERTATMTMRFMVTSRNVNRGLDGSGTSICGVSHERSIDSPVAASYEYARVLITGGYGFVGSYLADRLVALGAQVTIVDTDCAPERPSILRNRVDVLDQISFYSADVTDSRTFRDIFATDRFDFVFHLAASSVVEEAAQDPKKCVLVNVLGLVNLLEGVCSVPSGAPRSIVTVSTDKVYGESGNTETCEDSALNGQGVYEATKIAADVLARTYHETHRLPVSVVRPCNIFGPHDYTGMRSRLVPSALHAIYGQETPLPPVLHSGSRSHQRDYLYIDDAVNMILGVGAEPTCVGHAFNLPGCANMSTSEMLTAVIETVCDLERDRAPELARLVLQNGIRESPTKRDVRVSEISTQRISGAKLLSYTGLRPTVGLAQGLRRTAESYRRELEYRKSEVHHV